MSSSHGNEKSPETIASRDSMYRNQPFSGSDDETGARRTDQERRGRDKRRWWKIHLFRGMIKDVKRRVPYYGSDWTDAWNYRVIPATVYMFFAKYGLATLAVLFFQG